MTRYDYDYGLYARRRLPPRRYRRRPEPFNGYVDEFGEFRPMGALEPEMERMGMHDFTEQFGRYSGGSPYSYEYSERTVPHRLRYHGVRGFSHPFGAARYERERRPPERRSERAYWLRREQW
jgi:hypothetical protein